MATASSTSEHGEQPYNVNFCFPVPAKLESERVALLPFIPSIHAEPFISGTLSHPETFTYLPFGPYKDAHDFVEDLIEGRVQKDPGFILFAVYDKTQPPSPGASPSDPGALAGLVGLLNTSPAHLVTEIGGVIILPAFHRTHVASNAVGLLLHYTLDAPSPGVPPPALTVQAPRLGLRRVAWQANALNAASRRLAERMGFTREAVLRWERILPQSKTPLGVGNGVETREGDPRKDYVGRDTALLSLCWDDWEGGVRERVDEIMRRVV